MKYGGIAQLGERLNGIQEVSGSIPLISTRNVLKSQDFKTFFYDYRNRCQPAKDRLLTTILLLYII